LSLLPSITKTTGKAEKAFWVAVTLPAWPQPCDSVGLKTQILIMSPVSEGIQLKGSLPEEGLNETHEGTDGRGVSGEPRAECVCWRRLQGKGAF
jgi:hypothetical protein